MMQTQHLPAEDVGFRFAKYLLALGLLILPILIYFDFKHLYLVPSAAKTVALTICIAGLFLARDIKNEVLVREGAAITMLIMGCIGAIYKLDGVPGLIWAPVLPAVFCFLAHIRRAVLYSLIFLLFLTVFYFSFESLHGKSPVAIHIWVNAILAYLIIFLVSIFFKGELQKDQAMLKSAADQDFLTGIANRRGFIPQLEVEIKRVMRYGSSLSIILLDIDKFKTVNDIYGHATGDTILIEIATLLNNEIRDNDIVARWGGEEFVILVPEADLTACTNLAEKLRKRIEEHDFNDVKHLTSSFGVTQYHHGETSLEFIKRSDSLLYEAKHAGRNIVIFK